MKHTLVIWLLLVLVASACSQAAPQAAPTAATAPTKAAAAPAAASAAPTVAAAAPTAVPAAPKPTEAAKPTGELRLALSALATEDWDPAKAGVRNKFFHRLMFDHLIGSDAVANKLSKDSGIASDWQVSADAMTLTINIRKGIKFHTGDELTAEDVKFHIDRLISPAGMSSWVGTFRDSVKEVVVKDPYTVVINMKVPAPLLVVFLSALSGGEGEIIPKKYIQEKGDAYFVKNPVGSGPYKLVEAKAGTSITMEAFDGYWRGAPKYKTVRLMLVPEESTRITMLKRGEVDIAEVSRENVGDLKKGGYNIFTKEGAAVYKVSFEMGKAAAASGVPITKLPVRQALSYAINRQELLDSLFYGQGKIAATQFGGYAAEYEALPPTPYDPEKAKKLLADAGYPKGFDLNYASYPVAGAPEQFKINEAVAGYWRAIGINVRLQQMDENAFLTAIRKGDLQKVGTVNGSPQQNQYLTMSTYQGSLHPNGRNGYLGFKEDYLVPDLAALIDKAASTIDDTQRIAALKQVQRYIYDNVLLIPMVESGSPFAANADRVKDWKLGALPYDFNIAYLYSNWKP